MFDPNNALRKMLGPKIGPNTSGFSNIAKGISKDVRSKNSNRSQIFNPKKHIRETMYIEPDGTVHHENDDITKEEKRKWQKAYMLVDKKTNEGMWEDR